MSTDYPAQILNHDGSEIEMEARINFTDPANAPGGSLPVTRAAYGGNNVSVPNTGAPTSLTWDTLVRGTALLDISVPALPTVVTAGVYALTVNTYPASAMTDGKAWELQLHVSGLESVDLAQTFAVEDSADFDTWGCLSVTHYMDAGADVLVTVQQAGAGSINFVLAAYLQRLA